MRTFPGLLIFILACALLLPGAGALAQSAGIAVGSASGLPGASVAVPVSFTPGATAVSTVQFDLVFSSSLVYTSATTGAAASAASKSVSANPVAGGLRVLVFGLNTNAIGAGVIANVQFTISAGAAPGAVPIGITGIVASDPDASPVPTAGAPGSVQVLAPADITAPVISNVSSSNVTSSGATISWTTNEAADTQVEYGTSTSYGSSTTLNTSRVTSHSQALSGLTEDRLYHYRVKSRDAAGNLAVSGDYTFTTTAAADTTPPAISGVTSSNVSSTGATISWTTNEAADTQVEYGTTTSYGSSTTLNTSRVTSHTQALSGLTEDTLYHYRVRSRDAAGNLAVSGDYTFTTTAAADTTPPAISGVTSSNITSSGATISWTTNEPADTQVEYGTSTSYGGSTTLNTSRVTSHTQALSGLTEDTLYHYRVRSRDAAGNLAVSGDYTFTTTAEADTTPPAISGVTSSNVTGTGATISWTTNEAADTQVEYGTTASYGSSTALNGTRSTAHSQALSGLTEKTLYHYRVKSRDAAGNLAVSGDYTFTTTAAADKTPPAISGVTSSNITGTGATISWTTNEPADTQVEYGTTASYGSSTTLNGARSTSHTQALTGLTAGKQYHYRVKSKDAAGNLAVSGNYSFTTTTEADTTPPTISGVTSSNVTGTGATISWTTNEPADTQVEYGTTASYGSSTTLNGARSTSHLQALSGLTEKTLYHYRVKSRDAAGNLAVSGDYTFTTGNQGAAPVISGVTISDITSRSATISWSTNEPADSAAEYWTAGGSVRKSGLGDRVTQHSLTLNKLQRLTQYRFRVKSTDPEGNQAVTPEYTFTTAAFGSSKLTLPRFLSQSWFQHSLEVGEENMIGMAVTNMGYEPAAITFTAVDDFGNLITGPGIVNPKSTVLDPKSQLAVLDFEVFGEELNTSGSKGWIKLESASPHVGGFFLTFDGSLTLMDGANFGDVPLKDFAFSEIEPSGSTQINVANGNPDGVSVTFYLMKADGTVRSSQSRTIRANGALVADLYEDLFPGIDPDPTDYVAVRSTEGVQPFALMRKRIGDISSLTGQDLSAGATTLYSPQYVVGGPWMTRFSILNLDSRAGMVTLRFYNEGGVQMGATRAFAIPAYGKLYVDDPEFFLPLDPGETAAGYVEIVGDGIRLAGSAVFGDSSGNSLSSALPLASYPQNLVLYSHIASDDLYYTGIAIMNPNATDTFVTIELYGEDGALIDSTTEYLPSRQRKARLLTEYFESMVGKKQISGYIRVISANPIVSFAMFGTNNLSVLSAIPPQEMQ